MLPVYDWIVVGNQEPSVTINKTTGAIKLNAPAYQLLGFPRSVELKFDSGTNTLGIMYGFDYLAQADGEEIKVDAKDALEDCGLVFPLANNIVVTPEHSGDSRNMLYVKLD